MSSTPREIVQQALRFESPARLPRDLWGAALGGGKHTPMPGGTASALAERFGLGRGGVPSISACARRPVCGRNICG